MDLQHFMNQLTQIREHLGPLRERLEEAKRTAPTAELQKMAGDLLAGLSQSYDESVVEIRNLVSIYSEENAKAKQTLADLEKAAASAMKQKAELQAAAVAPSTPPPIEFNPAVLEHVKQQLLEHVGLVSNQSTRRIADGGGHFSDWVNESVAMRNSGNSDLATTKEAATRVSATRPTAEHFDSWLQQSIHSIAGTAMSGPRPTEAADPENDQREWEKLLGR